jgi:LysM repeat protein
MKNKTRVIKLTLTILVLLSVLVLGACNRPKATPPAAPTLAVPISTLVVEDEADSNIDEAIEIIQTEVPEEEEAQPTEEPAPTEEPTEAPEPTEVPVEIPEITRPESYTLQKDEFPYCVARRFDVNIADLMNLNGITGGQSYYEGMVLKIPTTGNWNEAAHGDRSLRTHPVTYTVQAGDNIYHIACKFGDVSPEQIAAKNGLEKPYFLSPGTVLDIP